MVITMMSVAPAASAAAATVSPESRRRTGRSAPLIRFDGFVTARDFSSCRRCDQIGMEMERPPHRQRQGGKSNVGEVTLCRYHIRPRVRDSLYWVLCYF